MSAYQVKLADDAERRALTQPGGLGDQFWQESEFKDFADPDMDLMGEILARDAEGAGHFITLVGYCKDEMVGFLVFTAARQYTKQPLGQLFMLYVAPRRRYGPLGRMLIRAAELVARELGCVVFYAGATANIGRGVDERLMNMLDKEGYRRLGGVSRKVLEGGA